MLIRDIWVHHNVVVIANIGVFVHFKVVLLIVIIINLQILIGRISLYSATARANILEKRSPNVEHIGFDDPVNEPESNKEVKKLDSAMTGQIFKNDLSFVFKAVVFNNSVQELPHEEKLDLYKPNKDRAREHYHEFERASDDSIAVCLEGNDFSEVLLRFRGVVEEHPPRLEEDEVTTEDAHHHKQANDVLLESVELHAVV